MPRNLTKEAYNLEAVHRMMEARRSMRAGPRSEVELAVRMRELSGEPLANPPAVTEAQPVHARHMIRSALEKASTSASEWTPVKMLRKTLSPPNEWLHRQWIARAPDQVEGSFAQRHNVPLLAGLAFVNGVTLGAKLASGHIDSSGLYATGLLLGEIDTVGYGIVESVRIASDRFGPRRRALIFSNEGASQVSDSNTTGLLTAALAGSVSGLGITFAQGYEYARYTNALVGLDATLAVLSGLGVGLAARRINNWYIGARKRAMEARGIVTVELSSIPAGANECVRLNVTGSQYEQLHGAPDKESALGLLRGISARGAKKVERMLERYETDSQLCIMKYVQS